MPYKFDMMGKRGLCMDQELPNESFATDESSDGAPEDRSEEQARDLTGDWSEDLGEGTATEGVPQWTSPYIKPIHLITDIDSQDPDTQGLDTEEDV
ncbi:hypothetical protein [Alicyclobacillus ferrooxydans]|uniref:Uncharacterized protein n=1 Tax=Alicyclobacillus ferrooxydans TaxID=471514 RepID=A0A0P9CHF9_9BACL|nr:hypothetical protein [Alicyclobacillus ferrooxydans]KPV44935.1 hypothetical protein AN477_04840 [Alicyclobacillus ferrooxydans]